MKFTKFEIKIGPEFFVLLIAFLFLMFSFVVDDDFASRMWNAGILIWFVIYAYDFGKRLPVDETEVSDNE